VLWVRLAFALLAFTTGTTIVAYIILWILVPEAKTAADKLAMMGEQANAQNIARMVERGIEDLSSTIKDNWKQWHSKKKSHEGRFDTMSNQSDKPFFIFLLVVIPLLVISKVGDIFIKVVRRVLFSRSLTRARNQFV
jgi:hypothetical protein